MSSAQRRALQASRAPLPPRHTPNSASLQAPTPPSSGARDMVARARAAALALSLAAACVCAARAGPGRHRAPHGDHPSHPLGAPDLCGPPGVAGGWVKLARGEADTVIRRILVDWMAE